MSEYSDFILVNRNTLGPYIFVGCHMMSENSGVGLRKFHCILLVHIRVSSLHTNGAPVTKHKCAPVVYSEETRMCTSSIQWWMMKHECAPVVYSDETQMCTSSMVHICVSSLYTSGAHSCFIIHHCILLLHIRVYYLYSFTYTDVQHVLSITWYTCRLTVAQRVPLVEQELFTPSLRSILILYK
jgi:hypothetical protein